MPLAENRLDLQDQRMRGPAPEGRRSGESGTLEAIGTLACLHREARPFFLGAARQRDGYGDVGLSSISRIFRGMVFQTLCAPESGRVTARAAALEVCSFVPGHREALRLQARGQTEARGWDRPGEPAELSPCPCPACSPAAPCPPRPRQGPPGLSGQPPGPVPERAALDEYFPL